MAAKFRPHALVTSFYDRRLSVGPIKRLREIADVKEVNLDRCLTEQELAKHTTDNFFKLFDKALKTYVAPN